MGMRMPAEFGEHEACLMAWPTRESLWGEAFAQVKGEYAAVARAIREFEPVVMVARPGTADEARELCGPGVEVVELPIDDSWLRDSGPIFAVDGAGGRVGLDFRFNAWGGKHYPWADDDRVSRLLLDRLRVDRVPSSMVLEGGAITVDGEGTVITTEQCLLHPNRNPAMGRAEIEAELRARLGAEKVVWLPYGGFEDDETDGHVDGVCAYVGPARVVLFVPEDRNHPDHARMRANRAILEHTTDARGRGFEIVELPQSGSAVVAGRPTEVSYLNFYIANGGVVVPTAGVPQDAQALAVIARALPDRKVVGVETPAVAYGGGGVHCITQQLPSR
ncbi:agmatine deiminase family protein [Actinomadura harenae]|uniref:Agmatine deiminase family protein n=1 Tax=Actinomadura harenae TaxID=2483351 RepID=A0A3M2MA34_9ACTN|nr:agmatine deiminase family protein [Actinomadura harenae]RMI45465.1 agmatine deiminase family protein [Actinomadura harenae]